MWKLGYIITYGMHMVVLVLNINLCHDPSNMNTIVLYALMLIMITSQQQWSWGELHKIS
jgi:hypothetical protein